MSYESSKFGFSIKYPNGSTVNETDNGVDFNLPNGDKADVRVLDRQNMDINQVTQQELHLDKYFPNRNVTSSKDSPLAGHPGHELLFDTGIDALRVLEHWTITDGKEYKLEFILGSSEFPNFISTTAAPMQDSFQIGR